MLYRKMPKVKEELSILGFGCMRLPVQENGKIDRPRAVAQIRHAIDNGVNYLDTAWPYHGGDSERLVGEALQNGYRDKAFVATKLPSWMVKSRSHMDEFLDQQCKNLGTEGLMYAAQKNLGVIVMEPLRGGNLGVPQPPPEVARIWDSAPKSRTSVEWALRWVWDHPEVTVVLSGMNEEAHVEENLKIAAGARPESLTSREKDLVKQAAETYRRLMAVNCTGCEYCKPCPEGVNISGAFEILNKLHLFKNEPEARFMYAIRCGDIFSGGHLGYASQCIQCGECLDKCPQGIAIPDMLEQVVADLEDDKTLERLAMGKKMLNM